MDALCSLASITILLVLHQPATSGLFTRSLHDALPISCEDLGQEPDVLNRERLIHPQHLPVALARRAEIGIDRKSTRLNSSHVKISYAVFCLKEKTNTDVPRTSRFTTELLDSRSTGRRQ